MRAAIAALTCALLVTSTYAQGNASPPQLGAPPPTPATPVTPPPTPATPATPPTPATPASPPKASPPTPATPASPPKASPPAASPPRIAPGSSPSTPPGTPPTPTTPTTPATPYSSTPATPQTLSTSGSNSGNGQKAPTDADILYFAYNLEIFEGSFYSCAAFGTPLPSQYLGGGPAVTSCNKANLTGNYATFAAELAREETAHVALLYTALKAAGVNPVAPAVDITTAFTAAATAANANLSSFSAYANGLFFTHAAFIFEDLGASAYLGALNSISNSSYRLVAAQIAATESYHASLIRTILYENIDVVAVPGFTVRAITDAIVAVLNKLTGTPQLKYQIYNNQGSSVSNVDSNGLVPAASAQQVLKAVTLGAASGSGGGFFPKNLNGNVKN